MTHRIHPACMVVLTILSWGLIGLLILLLFAPLSRIMAGCISIREKPSVEITLHDRHQLFCGLNLRRGGFIA